MSAPLAPPIARGRSTRPAKGASAWKAALQACAGWMAFRFSIDVASEIVPGSTRMPVDGLRFLGVFVVAIPLTVAALALILRVSGERLRDIGLVRPSTGWTRTIFVALVTVPLLVGAAGTLAKWLSDLGLSDGGEVFDVSPLSLAGLLVGALLAGGFGEELLFRGFLLTRLERVFAARARPRTSAWLAVGATSAAFGLGHLYQGWLGAAVTTFYGLALGALYLAARRELALPMIVHGGIDVVGLCVLAW